MANETTHPSVTPFLWFQHNPAQVVAVYRAIFSHQPDPSPDELAALPPTMSSTFTLNGQTYIAFHAGPFEPLSKAFSLMVECDTQEEIDYFWQRLTANGGEPGRCGWLVDRFGLSWQVAPRHLRTLLANGAGKAMMGMSRLDIAELEAAAGVKA